MKRIKKITTAILTVAMMTASMAIPTMAASHDPGAPTILTPSVSYTSNAYYGDEYYTFTIDESSDVNVWLGRVAMNHTYTMTLSGNGIDPISTNDSSYNDELTLDAVLQPGTYYIDVDSDFGSKQMRTEPDETWYNIIVTAVPL